MNMKEKINTRWAFKDPRAELYMRVIVKQLEWAPPGGVKWKEFLEIWEARFEKLEANSKRTK